MGKVGPRALSFRPQRRGTRCGEPEPRGSGTVFRHPWVPDRACGASGMTMLRTYVLGLNALYVPHRFREEGGAGQVELLRGGETDERGEAAA